MAFSHSVCNLCLLSLIPNWAHSLKKSKPWLWLVITTAQCLSSSSSSVRIIPWLWCSHCKSSGAEGWPEGAQTTVTNWARWRVCVSMRSWWLKMYVFSVRQYVHLVRSHGSRLKFEAAHLDVCKYLVLHCNHQATRAPLAFCLYVVQEWNPSKKE